MITTIFANVFERRIAKPLLSAVAMAFLLSLTFITPAAIASSEIHAKKVPAKADDIRPILIGQKMPEITLHDAEGKPFKLHKAVKEKPTLIIFYRGGWCPYCNVHLSELRKAEKPLADMGFQILAISPDLPKFLRETGEKNTLGYTLLSDSQAKAAQSLGLAFKVGEKTQKAFKKYGIDLHKNSGQKHNILPVPSAIMVDTHGLVTFTFISPNYKVRVSNELILAAAKAQLKRKPTKK